MTRRLHAARIFAAGLLGAAVLAGGVASVVAADAGEPRRFAGRTLTDALLGLEADGLRVLFTSHVVRPDMRVVREPTSMVPREILVELLAEHGLRAEETTAGAFVVLAGTSPTRARGRVRSLRSGEPLAGARVLVPASGVVATSDADGRFVLPELPAGEHALEVRLPGFVVEHRRVTLVAGRAAEIEVELISAPLPLDEIVVTPSVVSLLDPDPVAALALDRDEIAALPHLGDDLFRSLTLMPGTAGEEISAEIHIRGSRADEVLVVLDLRELFEPFHLRDFGNAQSIVAPQAIGEVELILGGFPARYGDRMGGVLDMRTVSRAGEGPRTHLGLHVFGAQAGSGGPFAGGRGEWLGVVRFGSLELASNFLSEEENPTFGDVFAKVEYRLGEAHRFGVRALHAEDRLDFLITEDGELEQADTAYGSSYGWASHQAILGRRGFVDTVLARDRIDRDRRTREVEGEDGDEGFTLRDERLLEIISLKQDWSYAGAEDRSYWRWGFELRRLDAAYDYFNERRLDDTYDAIRSEPRTGTTALKRAFRSDQLGLYVSDRLRLSDRLTAEIGLRYDEQTLPADADLSPRLNVVYRVGERGTLRGAWGHFLQSHRPHELQVEDGETTFFPAELTVQAVVGYEHRFAGGASLRLDLYHRDIRDPRPRFENAFEPISSFPEIEPDRVRFAPQRSTSRGFEAFLRGRRGGGVEWWVNYSYSRAEDEIDGREVPRGFDQPHALNADLAVELGPKWTLNLAFRYHTGWPTTAIGGRLEEDDEGENEPVAIFGPLRAERLGDYHRLDLRASRRWQLRKGSLTFFLDLQNLYDRENPAGTNVDFELVVRPDGTVDALTQAETWGGLLPSFGLDWLF